jgi:hypothetical protein
MNHTVCGVALASCAGLSREPARGKGTLRRSCATALAIAAAWLAGTTGGWAQLPSCRLNSVFPLAGQAGTTFDMTITGSDLDGANRLVFSHPGITAVQKTAAPNPFQEGPQPVDNTFTVTLAADVPPGMVDVRAVGKYGISNPRRFLIETTAGVLEIEPNNKADQATPLALGSVVMGRADGATPDLFKLSLQAGQRIIVDSWAQRLDSQMDTALALLDSQGRQAASNRDSIGLDSLLDFTAPADGDYVLKVVDFLNRGGPDYAYRLSVTTGPYVDGVFPPAGPAGTASQFTLIGRNLPGGQPTDLVDSSGRKLEQLAVQIDVPGSAAEESARAYMIQPVETGIDGFTYRWPSPLGPANPVFIGVARAPVVLEHEPNTTPGQAQAVTLPCEVAGRFYPRGDVDWVTFEAKKGDAYWIEVISQRMGVPSDPTFLVQQVKKNDKGEEQLTDIRAEDDFNANAGGLAFSLSTDDPRFRFSAPEDGTYRVMVRDVAYGHDARLAYRLVIKTEEPDFRLLATEQYPTNQPQQQLNPWGILLRKGGTEQINVYADRRDGFDGEITVSVEGLPGDVQCIPSVIGPGRNGTALVLKAQEGAAEWAGEIKVVGKAKAGDRELVRVARTGTLVWPFVQNGAMGLSRLSDGLALAVSGTELAEFVADSEAKVWEMCRAGTLSIPVKVARRGEFKGALAFNAVDVPQNVQANNFTVNGDQGEGNLPININANAPLGTFTFFLRADTQVSYKQNPEAAAAAAEAKKKHDQAVTDLTAASKTATEAKTAADKELAEAQAALKKAQEVQAAAVKGADEAAKTASTLAAKAQEAKTQSDAKPEDAGLKEAAAQAEKASQEAAEKSKTAAEAKTKADEEQAKAAETAKTAMEKAAAADKANSEASAKLKAATDYQAIVNKRAQDTANAANAKNVNVFVPALAVTLKITPAPITMAPPQAATALKQGEKLELPIAIGRLYSYAEDVTVELVVPNGVGGIRAERATIAKDQNQVNLVIEAAASAPPGQHACSVRATARLNNQNLPITESFVLNVEKVEKQ